MIFFVYISENVSIDESIPKKRVEIMYFNLCRHIVDELETNCSIVIAVEPINQNVNPSTKKNRNIFVIFQCRKYGIFPLISSRKMHPFFSCIFF